MSFCMPYARVRARGDRALALDKQEIAGELIQTVERSWNGFE